MQNYSSGCCEPCICSTCGTNVDLKDIPFALTDTNLVYMDKVYSYNKSMACPILEPIDTATEWVTEVMLGAAEENLVFECGCGERRSCGNNRKKHCNCGNCGCECTLGGDAVFNITRSYVLVTGLELEEGTLTEGNVTVDGVAVDSVVQAGNRYTAETANLIEKTGIERCRETGLPTKNFFLVTGAGPWTVRGTIVLEGTVNTGGKTCCFQARFTTPDEGITVTGDSTFAVQKLALPCSVGGVSPVIGFGFTGTVNVLNPGITVTVEGTTVTLGITGALALQPQINVEVVRRTLFMMQGREAIIPCDGTEASFAGNPAEECECEEECDGNVFRATSCTSCSW
ncbi:MAG: hypothetical protein E7225_02810 [Clostridiales bacterium]|nr:hypothetical protein [Clostridiales bacterium]